MWWVNLLFFSLGFNGTLCFADEKNKTSIWKENTSVVLQQTLQSQNAELSKQMGSPPSQPGLCYASSIHSIPTEAWEPPCYFQIPSILMLGKMTTFPWYRMAWLLLGAVSSDYTVIFDNLKRKPIKYHVKHPQEGQLRGVLLLRGPFWVEHSNNETKWNDEPVCYLPNY